MLPNCTSIAATLMEGSFAVPRDNEFNRSPSSVDSFPYKGKIKTTSQKVAVLVQVCILEHVGYYKNSPFHLPIPVTLVAWYLTFDGAILANGTQATLCGYTISDFALSQDTQRIFRSAARIARSMDCLSSLHSGHCAMANLF